MSTQVDNRIVEMQFDNRHFEKNVSTTMSTLDKLKQKLNFSGTAKGLENVNAAAKNVNMSGLGSAVETVSAKFSAMQVVGVTALANITNSAINAGKRIVSALTIDPVKTGLSEYETKINAIQVIKANTRAIYEGDEARQMQDIEDALADLNKYADRTIYNFAQMTDNVGKFVAQGLGVKEAAKAVQGMANLAGASGASAQDMARATYQMSQALGGTIRKIDWNSLRTANMASVELKNTLTDLAKVKGIDIEGMIAKKGTFEDTLEEGWLTGALFTEAMNIYSDVYSEAELAAMGFTEAQIANFKDLAKTAAEATTEVKTMSQLWDVLKETAQSGWTQTWEIIIGDFASAKRLWTDVQNYFSNIINKMSDARNALLSNALLKGLTGIKENLTDLLKPAAAAMDTVKEATKSIEGITKSLEEHEAVVKSVINGDWGHTTERWNKLTEAGYDWVHVQNLVNEQQGSSKRRTSEYTEWLKNQTSATEDSTEATVKMEQSEAEYIATLARLSDAELESLGYTKKQIEAFKELAKMADRLGMPIEELIENIDQINGRWLLIESFKNIGKMLEGMFKTIGDAWKKIFPPKSVEERAEGIFNLIAAFHKLTRGLTKFRDEEGNLTEDGEKLVRTFKGIFAIVDLVSTIFGGAFKVAFKVVSEVLKYFNLDILDVTAYIGDAIFEFRNFVKGMFDISKILDKIVPPLKNAAKAVKDFLVDGFNNIPKDMISGFALEIWDGIKTAAKAIWDFGKAMLAKLREAIDSHSPSKETMSIGKDFISGFIVGISEWASKAFSKIKEFGKSCVDVFGNIDFGNLIALGISGAAIVGVFKIGQALNALIAPLEAFDDIGDGFKKISKGLKSALTGAGWAMKGEAVKSVAIAIGILAASLVVLSFIKPENLWHAVGAIAALAAIIGVLVFTMSKFVVGDIGGIGKVVLSILGISAAMMLLAGALRIINKLDVGTVLGVMSGIIMLFVAIGVIANSPGAKKVGAFGFIMAKLGAALLLMTLALKIIGSMPAEQLETGIVGLIGLLGLITLFIALLQGMGKGNALKGVDKTLYSVAGVMLIMTIVAKMIGNMKPEQAIQGFLGVAALAAVIVLMVKFLKPLAKDQFLEGVGSTLFGVAAAMMVMALVMKIIGGMDPAKALQGMAGVTVLAGLIVGMVYALKPLEKDQSLKRVGRTLLMMSVAIGILALVATLLGFVSLPNLAKGITAVGLLSLMMMGLAKSIKGATDIWGTVVAMTAAIAILVASVAVLGLIDPTKLAAGTLAVTAILGMFALVLKMAGTVQKVTGTMWAMVAIIAILSAALFMLAKLPVENTLGAAAGLSMLLLALSGAMVILSIMSKKLDSAFLGIGLLVLMAVPLLAFVGVLELMSGVKNAEKNANLLTNLMAAMTLLLVPLTLIGLVGPAAALGLTVLTVIIGAIGLLVYELGKFMDKSDNLEKFVDKGLGLLEKLGLGIGKALGAIITGAVMGAAASLPILGASLSAFMGLAMPFINGVKMVDDKVLKGVGILAAAIALLGVADLIAMITTLGGVGLPALGGSLSDFWNYGKDFFEGIKGVDASALEGVKSLAQAILILTGADVIDSLTSWFTGGNSLADFGKDLPAFGECMKKYSEAVAGIDNEAIVASSTAAKNLAEMAKNLPNSGGWLGKIVGNNDMDEFGKQLEGFGESLKKYGKSVSGIGAYTESIQASVDAAKGVTDMADAIPNSGGWVGKILGNNDADEFGKQLEGFGNSLMTYGKSVNGIGEYAEAIKESAGAANSLTEVAKAAKDASKWDAGKSEFVKFGESLAQFGSSIKSYAINIARISVPQMASVNGELEVLAGVAEKLSGVDAYGFSMFGEALANLGVDGINKFINTFNGSVSKVQEAVNNFVASAAAAITLGKPNITTAVNTLIAAAMTALDGAYDSFYNSGMNLVKGFANGIAARSYTAALASKRMAANAAEAAKKELDEHSPSRVGYGIGDFFGIAFVNGIADNVKKAYRSSTELAKSAKSGLSDAIGRISDAINTDIDTQPTIRPVLDLSDVKAGAGTIGGMFGDSTVGVMANVRSISAGMSHYNQNGSNDDVISAINDLKNNLGRSGDTYQINGITYDDGSNITEAVRSLVRAAKVERRT